jgi:CheY-like chemotaxis protein
MSRPRTGHRADVVVRRPGHNESVSSSRLPTRAPIAGADRSFAITRAFSHRPEQPIRLLVVDDDPRVLHAIAPTIALEPDLVLVATAADAMTALAFAEGTAPLVALVDVLVPDELTGLALVHRLARRLNCAVVAMSVRGGLRDATLAAGAVAFVEKSGDIDALLDAARAAATRPPV